jgi:hypothetical protein
MARHRWDGFSLGPVACAEPIWTGVAEVRIILRLAMPRSLSRAGSRGRGYLASSIFLQAPADDEKMISRNLALDQQFAG